MKDIEDAHGQVIYKYYNKERSFDVVEREDGFINIDDGAVQYFSEYKNWAHHEKEAIKYARRRCLDLGCGAGRVILYLQKKGHYAVGIDSSPLAIKVCRMRGAKHAMVMDINDIGKLGTNSFDSIIMFGNNFGLFGSRKRARVLLKRLHEITSDNAIIIAESRDPYLTDNKVHFKYHALNRKRGRMPGQLRIRIRFMQYATPWYDYLIVSQDEMKEMLFETGWQVRKFINAEGFQHNGQYIAIIAKVH